MFGIFKRARKVDIQNLEWKVDSLWSDHRIEALQKHVNAHQNEFQSALDHLPSTSSRTLIFRLTVKPGWTINDDYWRPAVVEAITRTGVVARYPDHTEVLTWDKIRDAYPPEQALRENAQ